MADEYAEKVFYFCDHKKNAYCKKTVCLFEGNASTGCACFCTADLAFALMDKSGNPIVCRFDTNAENRIAASKGRLRKLYQTVKK